MCQDSHKFLWFTSDAGVVKFDGTNFTSYRKKDGLSSNDIVRIKEDKKGRIWFFNYNATVNYFFNNKIYNSLNSPFLDLITGEGFILDFFTDPNQTINFYNWQLEAYSLDSNNKVSKNILLSNIVKPSPSGYSVRIRVSYLSKMSNGNWIIWTNQGVFSQKDSKTPAECIDNNLATRLVFPANNNYYAVPYNNDDSIIRITSSFRKEKFYFPGNTYKIRTILEDSEGYLWISALDEGVYCMKDNRVIKWFDIKNALGLLQDCEHNIWISTQTDGIFVIDPDILFQKHFSRQYFDNFGVNQLCEDPIKGIWCLNSKAVFLYRKNEGFYKLNVPKVIQPLDIIYLSSNFDLWLGTRINGLCRFENFNLNTTLKLVKYRNRTFYTIPMKRIIKDRTGLTTTILDARRVLFIKNPEQIADNVYTYLGGQINNAYYNLRNEFIVNGKKNFIFRNNQLYPYSELSRFDGSIISEHLILNDSVELFNIDGDSLYLLRKHVFYNLTKAFNLPITLQIKKSIYDGSSLYFATMKDVFVCTNPLLICTGKPVNLKPLNIRFNYVNDILVNNDSLYIASDDGLTIIPKKSLIKDIVAPPIPYFRSITVNGKKYPIPLKELILKGQNNIQLSLGCISFFASSPTYSYMLEGADKKWSSGIGSEINIFYRNLPTGNYKFKLRVRKLNSEWSDILILDVSIKPTFFELTIVRIILILSVAFLIWLFFYRLRNQRMRKIEIDHQLVVLEQKALQSMMNPHFIFNSLGSIQNYLLKNKGNEAIIYLSNFARLIRQNLSALNTPMIMLDEEVERIKNYLDLERIRLEDKFQYVINVDRLLEEDDIYIPSMIIQPIVENSIWHGIASLKDGGYVYINFKIYGPGSLKIRIEDNGIGIAQSLKYANQDKDRQHLGMQIIRKRLELLSKKYNTKTSIDYSECVPQSPNPGTLVEIIVPFTYSTLNV